jgi:hypothetical protein
MCLRVLVQLEINPLILFGFGKHKKKIATLHIGHC